MVKIEAYPLNGVGGVRFGMKRQDVRRVFGGDVREFKKTKFSKRTTDDFGFCHVFYDANDECEAIEIFEEVEVLMNGKRIFPNSISCIREEIKDLEEDGDGSFTSRGQSMGIYAPSGKVESILFGVSGYYE